MVDYQPVTESFGNLIGICPVCGCLMNRRTSLVKIGPLGRDLDIRFVQAQSRMLQLGSRLTPSRAGKQRRHEDNHLNL